MIKGIPTPHKGDDLIVGHISIECTDLEATLHKLKELGCHFKQNISVPDPKKSKGNIFENVGDKKTQTSVVQYFITGFILSFSRNKHF